MVLRCPFHWAISTTPLTRVSLRSADLVSCEVGASSMCSPPTSPALYSPRADPKGCSAPQELLPSPLSSTPPAGVWFLSTPLRSYHPGAGPMGQRSACGTGQRCIVCRKCPLAHVAPGRSRVLLHVACLLHNIRGTGAGIPAPVSRKNGFAAFLSSAFAMVCWFRCSRGDLSPPTAHLPGKVLTEVADPSAVAAAAAAGYIVQNRRMLSLFQESLQRRRQMCIEAGGSCQTIIVNFIKY